MAASKKPAKDDKFGGKRAPAFGAKDEGDDKKKAATKKAAK